MTEAPELDFEESSLESLVGRLADEFIERRQRGERPDIEEYAARHPESAGVIRQVLAALELVRSAAPDSASAAAGGSPGPAPDGSLGDFQIIRELGQGGMGVVYEAEQISLGRRVALKVLPFAAALDARRLQRFKNEAHAAAQLHHTNIVPVYGVGCERGVHYYAMQFIDGRPLDRLIADLRRAAGKPEDGHSGGDTGSFPRPESADTPLADAATTQRSAHDPEHVRTAVRLALQAAEALDHAHQMGVVHRDIKPANLLVDARGELWVTDFGLAQVQSDARLTASGDLVGTLRYMSPEQALARRLAIDHRTDIYSLGVTLYELLTLEPAFGGEDRKEVLRRIAFDEPAPPRRLNRAIPRELETVVLKAMAKEPAERYQSARELADDLRRYLEDRPVRARRPSLALLMRKWVRRHRAVVTAATAAALLVLSGSTIVLWFQKKRADDNAAAATAARVNSDATYQVARDALDEFIKLREEPHFQRGELHDAQQKLLRAEADFYWRFVELRRDDPKFQFQRGEALLKLGQVTAQLGSMEEAVGYLAEARAIFAALTREAPSEARPRYMEGMATERLGYWLEKVGRLDGARAAYADAHRIMTRLVAADPEHSDYQRTLAMTCSELAPLLDETDPDAARRLHEDGVRRRRELWSKYPHVVRYASDLAGGLNNLAKFWKEQGLLAEARRAFDEALEIQRRVVKDAPQDMTGRAFLANIHFNLGRLCNQLSERTAEIEHYRHALTLRRALAEEYPMVHGYQSSLSECLHQMATALNERGRQAEARPLLEEAVRLQRKALKANPTVRPERHAVAHRCFGAALTLRQMGQPDEAVRYYRDGLAICRELVDEFPGESSHRNLLAKTLHNLANLTADPAQAHGMLEESITHQRLALATEPNHRAYREDLSRHFDLLGMILWKQGDHGGARKVTDEAIAFFERMRADRPGDPDARAHVASWHYRCANLLRTGDPAAAGEQYDLAIAIQTGLVEEFPGEARYADRLGASLNNLGVRHKDRKEWAKARELFERAVKHKRAAVEADPSDPEYRKSLHMSVMNLAHSFAGLSRHDEAKNAYRAEIAKVEKLLAASPDVAMYNSDLAAYLSDLVALPGSRGKPAQSCELLERAVRLQKRALELDPENPDYREYLATHHSGLAFERAELGEHAKAAESAAQVLALGPRRFDRYANAARAMHQCAVLAAKDPKLTPAKRKDTAREYAKTELALRTKVVKRRPADPEAYLRRGFAHHDLGQFAEAAADWTKTLELARKDPNWDNADLRSNRGAVYVMLGRYQEAHADLTEALRLKPGHAAAERNLLSVLLSPDPKVGDPKRALDIARRGVKRFETDAHRWIELGHALYRNDELKEALAALEKAKSLAKAGEDASDLYLALVHFKLGDKGRALRHWQKSTEFAAARPPEHAADRQILAEAARLLGVEPPTPKKVTAASK